MKETIAFSQLVELVAKKANTSARMSELFLQELFAIVTQSLASGEVVKIKGLGDFNVKPGDNGKDVYFTPDKSLAEAVNAPFAQFKAVELCDAVTDERLAEIDACMERQLEPEAFAEVQEEVVEQVFGIVWRDIRLHPVENLLFVILVREDRFGNDLPGDARDFLLVVAVGFDASVQIAAVFAVQERARCRNGRNQREQGADGSVQLAEFLVAVERKVDVGGLQVRPAVPLAVENAVVCLVDVETVVGPELHLRRVHEGVRCRGQEHRVDGFQRFVRLQDFLVESFS